MSTLKFTFFTIVILVLTFCAVVVTILNMYKPVEKVYIGDNFVGYFTSKQQFDEVYSALVTEKQQVSQNVKVYLNSDPTFTKSYIRDSLIASQNLYTNLRADIKTEYTVYQVAVNGKDEMTFTTLDDANKYSSELKDKLASLNVDIKTAKVADIGTPTTMDMANSIMQNIVDRNQPVEIPKVDISKKQTNTKSKTKSKSYTSNAYKNVPSNISTGDGGIWPTTSHYITSRFGYRSEFGDFHTGTDIAGHAGDPIYAYKSGVVVFAGWNSSGYGYLVKIDHGNGFQTWYAHNSSLAVSVGEQVSQGQVISHMGRTGFATGNHLHFEVRLNGVPVDSYNYIVGK